METTNVKAVEVSNKANGKHEPTVAELQARIAELEAKAATRQKISFKVSEKGGVSVYGMGRFPITLYVSQWDAFLPHVPELKAFIAANRAKLSVKE